MRRLLICGAFATWCFLNTWVEFAEGRVSYFARHDPLHAVALPVILCEVIITLAMLGAWELSRRRGLRFSRPIHLLFLASCLAPLGIGTVAALSVSPIDLTPVIREPLFWPVVLIVAVVPVGFAVSHLYATSWLLRRLFLYSWPVLAVVLVQAARSTLLRFPYASYKDRPFAASLTSHKQTIRVVWIIFDELSQTIAFGNRPAELLLPNFDGLKRESFYASTAEPPADSTELSMPSLTVGEIVITAASAGPNELLLRTGSRPEMFAWSSTPNVFDTAREMGFNTALVGWSHPYGRILNRSLTKCYWTAAWLASGVEERFEPQPLASAVWDRAQFQFVALPLIGHLPGGFSEIYQREEKVRRFSYLTDRAIEVVTDPAIGLALIHLPVPHPPTIYKRSTGELTGKGRIGYLDNVALADRTLGVLREAMERAGLWDATAVLVSADHGWRTSLWRGRPEWTEDDEAPSHQDTSGVPFLLKLPGQTFGVSYERRFNTVMTRKIITDILSQRLTSPEMIAHSIESGR